MDVLAIILSVPAIVISIVSAIYSHRADQRGKRAEQRGEDAHAHSMATAVTPDTFQDGTVTFRLTGARAPNVWLDFSKYTGERGRLKVGDLDQSTSRSESDFRNSTDEADLGFPLAPDSKRYARASWEDQITNKRVDSGIWYVNKSKDGIPSAFIRLE